MSIWNDFEALVASVLSAFGDQPTRWLLHDPKALDAAGPDDDGTWTQASQGPKNPEWRGISRSEAEEIAGLDLSDFNTGPASVFELAGEHDLLRSLANAPEPERLPGDYLRAVPVAALPFAHGPFRCAHMERFEDIGRLYEGLDRTVVGAHWYLTLTPEDFAACPFHKGDWRRVADASIAVLDSLAPEATHDDLHSACIAQALPKVEAEWLLSLFSHPIDWTPGATELTNGQHRSCALRAAAAELCVVDTYGYPPPDSPPTSPRTAACAALASHWVAQTSKDQ